ncbi:MAG: hypothetical protein KatS3mg111_4130 [Pirellulaceae bacterium]|nr:MAG: hypothetical protein KatS3mg111_4130 [Pirellulaceae bacterium]
MASIPMANPDPRDGESLFGGSLSVSSATTPPLTAASTTARTDVAPRSDAGPHSAPSGGVASPIPETSKAADASEHERTVRTPEPSSREAGNDSTPDQPPIFHRARQVRQQQGISLRTLARRMGIDLRTCRQWEDPHTNLTLSQLQSLQRALDVPLEDLLIDRESLSRPIEERAKLVRIMKTTVALRKMKTSARVQRLAETLYEQLIDLMPELAEVGGWPQYGSRRGNARLGQVACQPIDLSQLSWDDID